MPIPLTRTEDQLTYYFTTEAVATRPTSWEVSLHKGNPVLGNEVTTGDSADYVRQSAEFAVTTVDLGGPQLVAQARNTALISFAPAAAGSGFTVTHVAVREAGSGSLLAYGQVTPGIPVVEGTVVAFDIGDILIQD